MKKLTFSFLLLCIAVITNAKVFTVTNPDYKQSPYTGMTRDHWKAAALYLLDGPFSYVKDINSPMDLPKQEGKSYPRNASEVPTARMEALCRTMFLAGPLLKENPDLTIHGIRVGDYYRRQIASFLEPDSPTYLPLKTWRGNGGQKLVELGGLAVSLLMAPDVFWTPLPKDTRDKLAAVFKTYAEGETIDMNWRFFNQCLLSFLDQQGYEIKKSYLEDLVRKNLAAYVGDGWYHDAPLFDYYSMWAFQMYGPLWAESYGKTHYPEQAAQFMKNLSDIHVQYPMMFGRDGHMQMWGRSITYRMGAAIPLALTGLLHDSTIDYGWMRHICSGALLQFITNPDFMADDNLPNLGFYGHFEPCLQHYSCRGSVFWMAKIFLSLYLPADNPYWTAKETEGVWNNKKAFTNGLLITYAPKSKTLTTDYQSLGMAEFRNVFTRNSGFYYGNENYNRLSYNSALPWQADGKNGEVAMCYLAKNSKGEWETIESYTGDGLCTKCGKGWFRRKAAIKSDSSVIYNLKERSFATGIIREDVVEARQSRSIRMGYYALPAKHGAVTEYNVVLRNGKRAIILDNGEWQVATIMIDGWDAMEVVRCTGLHPEAERSAVVNLMTTYQGTRTLRSMVVFAKSGKKLNLDKAYQETMK